MPWSKWCTQGSKKCCLVLLGKLLVICPGKSWMSLIICDGPNWFGHYIKPKPYDSFTAEVIISSMFCSVLMWTGNLMVISHVEAVGWQQQPAIQPCTNSTVNFLGNPRGGTCEAPVIHLMRSIKLTPSMPEVKKKDNCSGVYVACKPQTHFRSSLLSLRKIASANPSDKTISVT